MRCIACGTEMRVAQVIRDDTMMVPGYERHTLQCPGCDEIEYRLVFSGTSASAPDEPASIATTPVPASPVPASAVPAASPPAEQAPVALVSAPMQPAVPEIATPIASILSQAESDLDEGEEMLRRAMAMVRAPAGPTKGLTDGKPATPAELAAAMRVRKPSRVVQIRHDPHFEPAYAAKDAQSGLVMLRHQDDARLRAMCERLGWQVIEDGAPGADDAA